MCRKQHIMHITQLFCFISVWYSLRFVNSLFRGPTNFWLRANFSSYNFAWFIIHKCVFKTSPMHSQAVNNSGLQRSATLYPSHLTTTICALSWTLPYITFLTYADKVESFVIQMRENPTLPSTAHQVLPSARKFCVTRPAQKLQVIFLNVMQYSFKLPQAIWTQHFNSRQQVVKTRIKY